MSEVFEPHSQGDFDWWREQRQPILPYLQKLYPQIEKLIERAETVIDLGGGEGHTHEMLSDELSPRLVTLDLDKSALRRLRAKHPDAQTIVGSMNNAPICDESFDAAIAINSIGGEDAREGVAEARRILKPGGTLVFLHDLPHGLMGRIEDKLAELPPERREEFYILPILNHASGNVDVFAYARKEEVEASGYTDNMSTTMAYERVEHLLGDDWIKKIYGDKLMVATYAKLFRRLVAEMQASFGESRVRVSEPFVPLMVESQLHLFEGLENFEGEAVTLEVDYETDEPHRIGDREVSSLYVDDMPLPRVVYKTDKSQRAGTRIRGHKTVFVGRKS